MTTTHYLSLFEKFPDKTCLILKKDDIIFTSVHKGVKPMLDYYHLNGHSTTPLTVVDKIMGKGAIVLALMIGASTVYTPTISEIALKYGEENGLIIHYQKSVPYIINRTGDGQCPIEKSVSEIEDISLAYDTILKTLEALRA